MEGNEEGRLFLQYLTSFAGLLFNVNGGYLEGIVRGYRNALLTSTNYGNVSMALAHFRPVLITM